MKKLLLQSFLAFCFLIGIGTRVHAQNTDNTGVYVDFNNLNTMKGTGSTIKGYNYSADIIKYDSKTYTAISPYYSTSSSDGYIRVTADPGYYFTSFKITYFTEPYRYETSTSPDNKGRELVVEHNIPKTNTEISYYGVYSSPEYGTATESDRRNWAATYNRVKLRSPLQGSASSNAGYIEIDPMNSRMYVYRIDYGVELCPAPDVYWKRGTNKITSETVNIKETYTSPTPFYAPTITAANGVTYSVTDVYNISYESSKTSVATVSSAGKISVVGVGSADVTITLKPKDAYKYILSETFATYSVTVESTNAFVQQYYTYSNGSSSSFMLPSTYASQIGKAVTTSFTSTNNQSATGISVDGVRQTPFTLSNNLDPSSTMATQIYNASNHTYSVSGMKTYATGTVNSNLLTEYYNYLFNSYAMNDVRTFMRFYFPRNHEKTVGSYNFSDYGFYFTTMGSTVLIVYSPNPDYLNGVSMQPTGSGKTNTDINLYDFTTRKSTVIEPTYTVTSAIGTNGETIPASAYCITNGALTTSVAGEYKISCAFTGGNAYFPCPTTYSTLTVEDNALDYHQASTTKDDLDNAIGITIVNVDRTFVQGWNTLCLPFDYTMEQFHVTYGADAKVYHFEYATKDVVMHFRPHNAVLGAGVPYLIYIPAAVETPTFTDVSVSASVGQTVSKTDEDGASYHYVGILSPTSMSADQTLRMVSQNKLSKPSGAGTLKGTRCYFDFPRDTDAGSSAAKAMTLGTMSFLEEDSTTPVATIAIDEPKEDGNIYDLTGRNVSSPRHGVFLIGGKKVVVK